MSFLSPAGICHGPLAKDKGSPRIYAKRVWDIGKDSALAIYQRRGLEGEVFHGTHLDEFRLSVKEDMDQQVEENSMKLEIPDCLRTSQNLMNSFCHNYSDYNMFLNIIQEANMVILA